MTTKRYWTFMVYMAGDNGKIFDKGRLMAPMESAGYQDIAEMELVGSNQDVAVLVQFDTLSETTHSSRLFIQPAGIERKIELISEQNMGDPTSLRDFIIWGIEHYPAEHYAVILWNHGTGWKDEDIYAFARKQGEDIKASQDEVRSAAGARRICSGLFLSSALKILTEEDEEIRGIAYDDSSMDFLDNLELQQAFREAEAQTGERISLIGMDACLMSMIEVAYQLRMHADYLVGSQEVEPMAGWPYTPILQKLVQNPAMEPAELAKVIVEEYERSFDTSTRGSREPITQSAITLARTTDFAETIGALTKTLQQLLKAEDIYLERSLFRAQRSVMRFRDSDYVDLCHLLSLLQAEYDGDNAELKTLLGETLSFFSHHTQPQLVLAHVPSHTKESPSPAPSGPINGYGIPSGLSIYFPTQQCSPLYKELDFANHGWSAFIGLLSNR